MSNNEKRLFEISELVKKNGGPIPISKSGLYAAVKNNDIPSKRIRGRIFIPSWAIDQLVNPPEGQSI